MFLRVTQQREHDYYRFTIGFLNYTIAKMKVGSCGIEVLVIICKLIYSAQGKLYKII